MPKINRFLVKFFANNFCREIGFTVPISFYVVLIIRLFGFPSCVIQGNRKYCKFLKLTILKRVLRNLLYEAGCSNLQIPKWWDNSQPLHRHRFLEAIYNCGCFKPWTFKLLYSTALHGFSNSTFHQLCDRQGTTMTIMKLNGKIVVAFVEKSWNTQDISELGFREEKSCKIFHVNSTGKIVKLRCTGFYNTKSLGPHFKFLEIDLNKRDASCTFPENNEFITGSRYGSYVCIDSVAVLKMSIFFESFPKSLLMQIVRENAPYLKIQ
jgi:hypothetical protein